MRGLITANKFNFYIDCESRVQFLSVAESIIIGDTKVRAFWKKKRKKKQEYYFSQSFGEVNCVEWVNGRKKVNTSTNVKILGTVFYTRFQYCVVREPNGYIDR